MNNERATHAAAKLRPAPIPADGPRSAFRTPKARRRLPVKTMIATGALALGLLAGCAGGHATATSNIDSCVAALGDAERMVSIQDRALDGKADAADRKDLNAAATTYMTNAAICRASN